MVHITPRQVHLDFHTSELIQGIGTNFSKEQFQKALKVGTISSITIFAKCHHGYCYYPTQIGTMHPNLDFDLLGCMLEAAHEIGVKAPIYITGGWSELDARTHPEWWVKNQDGTSINPNSDIKHDKDTPKPEYDWTNLCLSDGSYAQHIYDLTREICERYDVVDGLFYDICFVPEACYCDECIKGMKEDGLNPCSPLDAKAYYIRKHQSFMQKCKSILNEKHPDGTIFFNSGGADPNRPEYHPYSTHFEMEDLPTTWGGYDTMPPTAMFFSRTGKDYLGMTGKFHTSWGEFGGYKIKEALKYECAAMMSFGAGCSIGDQLHPDGEMDLQAYENIGYAYDYVKKIEEYCLRGKKVTRIGLYLSGDNNSDKGAVKMLLETQTDFNIVYQDKFDEFDLVIFPDTVSLNKEGLENLNKFICAGGKVIFTGKSLVENNEFQLDPGAEYKEEADTDIDYIAAGEQVQKGVGAAPLLAYFPAYQLRVIDGTVLATVMKPYFRRTYGAFCSHKNTPYNKNDGGHPAMVQKGNILYIAHPIFKIYQQYGSIYHRNYFMNAFHLLYPQKNFDIHLQSAGRATLSKQENKKRYCFNVLYGAPITRTHVEVIEDLLPLYNIPVVIRVSENVTRVWLPVQNEELNYHCENGEIHFILPYFQCHELIVLEYQ